MTGKVGDTVTADEAYAHALLVGLNLLSVLHVELGDLSRVKRIVKLLGMVNATPDFADHPRVINGCSDLFVDVFGDAGRHSRSAVGVGSLPGNITVEIEAIVAIHD
jgi:enamine deaminase RidA (YjgF/YER057c/UK114 family)